MVRQESHRVYWQQSMPSSTSTASSIGSSGGGDGVDNVSDGGSSSSIRKSKLQLITSSAAVRMSDAAKAKDVTNLIRKSALNLPISQQDEFEEQESEFFSSSSSTPTAATKKNFDALVLVATFRNLQHQQMIRFEHEPPPPAGEMSSSNYKPFHVVRTLLPNDSPLKIRDEMVEKLKHKITTTHTNSQQQHQIRWFFVPGVEPSGNIPNCIELDGYSTSMDDEEYSGDKNEDDDNESTHIDLLVDEEDNNKSSRDMFAGTSVINLLMSRETERNKVLSWFPPPPSQQQHQQEQHELIKLNRHQGVPPAVLGGGGDNHSITGYLLKRSERDIHVWKRVYCILTDDHLWYVSRVYNDNNKYYNSNNNDRGGGGAYHRKISLTKALLLEQPMSSFVNNNSNSNRNRSRSNRLFGRSSSSSSIKDDNNHPLSRIPCAFEIVSSKGKSHYFRASDEIDQIRWISCISNRIVQCHDNNLIEHAELIVGDETNARHKRLAKQIIVSSSTTTPTNTKEHKKVPPTIPNNYSINAVVQFGMEVAEYKERIRHILAFMPAKTPVVIRSTSTEVVDQRMSPSTSSSSLSSPPRSKVVLDNDTHVMICAAWDIASALLATGTHISLLIKEEIRQHDNKSGKDGNKKPTSSLRTSSIETVCQHVEYVLTGQFRSSSSSSSSSPQQQGSQSSSSSVQQQHRVQQDDPPPADLFDSMLLELQKLAAAATTTSTS